MDIWEFPGNVQKNGIQAGMNMVDWMQILFNILIPDTETAYKIAQYMTIPNRTTVPTIDDYHVYGNSPNAIYRRGGYVVNREA